MLVEDDPTTRALLSRRLSDLGFTPRLAETGEEALEMLHETLPEVICLDLELPGMSGLETLERILDRHPWLPVIILTADRQVETVVTAMQKGAHDYLAKPVDATKLATTIRNASKLAKLTLKVQSLEREATEPGYRDILGRSAAMLNLFRQLDRVSQTDVTVLVHGESGTGKELVARAIHESSARRPGPFVALNCAAIPESLQESEFFGHEKGSFTGAITQRKGRFEQADGGTLFLDEVGELSLGLQAKLLRVLQERTFQRVGSGTDIRSDFRLVAATHRNLEQDVEQGRFRGDLYFRLTVFELLLPALRDRHGDVELLAREFTRRGSLNAPVQVDAEALDVLCNYPFPGNVRELENAIQRALVVCQDGWITAEDLPARMRGRPSIEVAPQFRTQPSPVSRLTERTHGDGSDSIESPLSHSTQPASAPSSGPSSSAPPVSPARTMEEAERLTLEQALAATNGNVSEAVKQLGIGRTTAYRLIKKYGIEVDASRRR